ncbi:uncharacterized protein LOC126895932 [Daktulosphaira vitifoliae]|uniref:uncharacterized protein LOC126895932 n=1 Tax=Daktulosphaira vitifoliae TaxID=58002 RepID=UPI0021AADEB0|nr:uncharacterized protein LOC126895932 [Daktulosphaira vitifoliae]XP_050524347.1 uncharacterized protein LOC126895932 [Daktulosphaira vitifoliae]
MTLNICKIFFLLSLFKSVTMEIIYTKRMLTLYACIKEAGVIQEVIDTRNDQFNDSTQNILKHWQAIAENHENIEKDWKEEINSFSNSLCVENKECFTYIVQCCKNYLNIGHSNNSFKNNDENDLKTLFNKISIV